MKRETSNTNLKGEIDMFLRVLLDKLDYKLDESYTKTALKGLAEGALEGLVIVGAIELVSIAVDSIKKK